MQYWNDRLKLGKGTGFIKRDLRLLPLTEAEFEADFFLVPHSTKGQELWVGMVVTREFDDVLAMDDVWFPPPTVNDLANLLAHAMLRPMTDRDRQRPQRVHLRDRPQWPELFPHLQQLGIEGVLADDLPWFDKAVLECVQHRAARHVPLTVADEETIRDTLKRPFPEKERTDLDASLDLMHWMAELLKAGYPSARKGTSAAFDPLSIVTIHLTDEELQLILTETDVARTKKLRPRLEAIVGSQQDVQLSVHEWGLLVYSSCGAGRETRIRERLMAIAEKIARSLADAVGLQGPPLGK
jgi:hypothetical protein